MTAILRNVRYATRVLARTPGFTLTIVLTLALVIGANTAVFSLINAVLLRQLPFPEADRLVLLSESREGAPISNTAPVRIEEWNEASTTFEAITGYYTEDVSETSGDLPEKFRMARVAPRFMDVWGVAPALGRGFTAAESEVGAPAVVLISHRFWTTHLRGDPSVLERHLRLGDQEFSIIGVMPASFRFPDRDMDLWTPRIYAPFVLGRGNLWYSAYGRLAPGVTLEQARADLTVIQARLAEQYPETDEGVGVYVAPLQDSIVGGIRGSLWIVFGAVSMLLLIAATNVAALLLARAAHRNQEVAVRLSLGAPRSALVVQSLTETALLAAGGAALGLLVAAGVSAVLRASLPSLPRIEELALDGRILLYTLSSIVAVTALCGLLPAIRATRARAGGVLVGPRRTQVSGRHWLQWSFVGVQVALAVVLLAGSGLLIRSFLEISRVDPGFEATRVLSFRVSGSYEDFARLAPRVETILAELGSLPGVESVATSSPVPGVIDDGSGFQFGIAEFAALEGRAAEDTDMLAQLRFVSPSYFATMQIPLLSGEPCRAAREGAVPEVMVNTAFASRYFPGAPIVGSSIRSGGDVVFRVAGVVGDAREFALDREPAPTVYPCRLDYANPALSFLVRTRGDPSSITETVRAKVKELEPLRAVYDVAPLGERIGNEYTDDRLRTAALALFAAAALSLACLGVYGTLSHVASLRRREVGLRVALGALQGHIVRQFLAKALRVVGIACVAGLVLALALSRSIAGMLYGVSPIDPLTLTGVVTIVVAVAAFAAFLPALRASRVDPMDALREE